MPQKPDEPKQRPPQPLQDPPAQPARDPPGKPLHDPPADPTREPNQPPIGVPTPGPGIDPPVEAPGDPKQRIALLLSSRLRSSGWYRCDELDDVPT
jgi:hypothetical protein